MLSVEEDKVKLLEHLLWRPVPVLAELGLVTLATCDPGSAMNATTHSNVVQALWLRNGFVVVCPFVAVGEFAENVTHATAIQE